MCVVTSAISIAVVAAYRLAAGNGDLDYLFWNLALAWVPFVAALALDDVRSTPLRLQLPLLALWLVFFPNAPYLVTDLIHIDPADHGAIGIFGDAALVSVAPAGLALGFSSLALVERTVRGRFGGRVALAVSVLSLAAASLGIYLGRVVRLNSWDLLTRPRLIGACCASSYRIRSRIRSPSPPRSASPPRSPCSTCGSGGSRSNPRRPQCLTLLRHFD